MGTLERPICQDEITSAAFIGYDPNGLFGKPIWESVEAEMRLDDRIRKTVVFIGTAARGPFLPIGTGFIALRFVNDQGFQHVITAKHVIDAIPGDPVHIRLNRMDGRAQVIETTKGWWRPHPDKKIDLMVCPTRIPKDQFDIMHWDLGSPNMLDHVADPDEVGIGDEVYVAGMFIGRVGETKNIPILRVGTLAAMPEEKVETQYGFHHAYLIEARSIDGLSGSPVFAFTSMWRLKDGKVVMQPVHSFYMIGMLLGHNQVINPSEVIEIAQKGGRRPRKARSIPIPLNTGIGVVLPITHVIEAVDQEPLRIEREKVLAQKAKASGYVSDAVKTAAPEASANPRHKEDFTALLDAATRGNKPTDRT